MPSPDERQRTRDNPYLLPDNLYKSVKFAIKDYDRLKDRYQDILYESAPPSDGMPRGSDTATPTEDRAMRREIIFRQLWCIEQAIMRVPPEYRDAVFREARYGGGFPIYADRRTYQRWKQRFIFWTAENMSLV